MLHLAELKKCDGAEAHFFKKATGRYYTGEPIGRQLAQQVAVLYHSANPSANSISVVDPFGGDGRLIEWFIEAWVGLSPRPIRWEIAIWDIDDVGFAEARKRLARLVARYGIKKRCTLKKIDTFAEAIKKKSRFDLVITNPPWELLKPDRRELADLNVQSRVKYISQMRKFDEWLGIHYPMSQPKKKFAGWGTNLSRVGFEASVSLARRGGIVGVVLPASFLADDQTVALRKSLLTEHSFHSATYYPAEAKLYGSADVASIALAMTVLGEPEQSLSVRVYDIASSKIEKFSFKLEQEALQKLDYVIPISFGAGSMALINALAQRFPTWLDLETGAEDSLWAGREIDETGIARWLRPYNGHAPRFIKGRMIDRYNIVERPSLTVQKPGWSSPASTRARRIAWRDVSRPSQKRRMIATLIEAGTVAGNSLGVAYFRNMAETPLLALLGIMNSLCFEFQLRSHLATGHVSLSSLRKVAVPGLAQLFREDSLALLVSEAIESANSVSAKVDAYVAKNIYKLTEGEYELVVGGFALTEVEHLEYMKNFRQLENSRPARRRVSAMVVAEASSNYVLA